MATKPPTRSEIVQNVCVCVYLLKISGIEMKITSSITAIRPFWAILAIQTKRDFAIQTISIDWERFSIVMSTCTRGYLFYINHPLQNSHQKTFDGVSCQKIGEKKSPWNRQNPSILVENSHQTAFCSEKRRIQTGHAVVQPHAVVIKAVHALLANTTCSR